MIRVESKSEPIMDRISTAMRGASRDSQYVIVQPITDMLDSSIINLAHGREHVSFFSALALCVDRNWLIRAAFSTPSASAPAKLAFAWLSVRSPRRVGIHHRASDQASRGRRRHWVGCFFRIIKARSQLLIQYNQTTYAATCWPPPY